MRGYHGYLKKYEQMIVRLSRVGLSAADIGALLYGKGVRTKYGFIVNPISNGYDQEVHALSGLVRHVLRRNGVSYCSEANANRNTTD